MKIGKFRVSRKAISPVIASLLIIAIAVAASIVTYVWSMGLLGGLMGSGGQQTKEQLILEFYDWKGNGTLSFALRNVGSVNVNVASIYLEGQDLAQTGSVAIGSALTFTDVTEPSGGAYSSGASYVLKVITTTGGTFSYSIVKGRAG